jgi:hypothetical protein
MSEKIVRIFLLGLLLLLAIAPFATLAPLLLTLLVAGFASAIWSLVRVFLFGDRANEAEKNT